MSTLAQLEQELAERQDDINTCNEMLELEPDDEDALQTKELLQEQIADLSARIASEREKNAAPPPPPTTNDGPKFDMSKHPKFQQTSNTPPPPPPEDAQPTIFEVRDVVMAKYSDDKQWYQATIVSRTGSSTDPVYTVNFKGYGNTETKRKYEIRAIENKKRKAEGPPAAVIPQMPASPRPAGNNGAVVSAAPSVDPTLVQKREPSKVSDGPTRMAPEPKKLKGNKALDKQKSNWNDWQKNGPKKSMSAPKKKDSMFRTQDKPNTKPGFSLAGKPEARSKWNYGRDDDE